MSCDSNRLEVTGFMGICMGSSGVSMLDAPNAHRESATLSAKCVDLADAGCPSTRRMGSVAHEWADQPRASQNENGEEHAQKRLVLLSAVQGHDA